MREAEGLNFSLNIPGEKSTERKIPVKNERFTLDQTIKFIENLAVSQASKEKLIAMVKKMPSGSLSNFKKNYRTYLKRVS